MRNIHTKTNPGSAAQTAETLRGYGRVHRKANGDSKHAYFLLNCTPLPAQQRTEAHRAEIGMLAFSSWRLVMVHAV